MKKIFSFFAAILFAGSLMAESLLSIDFTQGQGEWTINNVELGGIEFVWSQSTQYGMKATGFVSGNHATEAWLISPAIDLSGAEVATLAFSHARRYGELSQLSVLAKAGEGEWTALEVSAWPDGSNWNFVDATADLSAFVDMSDVQVAFKYTSTAESGATWEIKTVTISNEGAVPPTPVEEADVIFTSADFNGQGTSGTGGVVTATKNGVTFTCDKGFGDQYGVRCYKTSNVSIVSESEQIGKIAFEFATVSGKTYSGGLAPEIAVNGMEWTNTMADQARMNKVSIYFGESGEIIPTPTPSADTITVAEALEIGSALESGKATEKEYVIKGYSTVIESAYDPSYKNETFWIADEKESTAASNEDGAFKVFRGKPNTEKSVGIGALVYVTSKIQKYGDKNEIESWSNSPVNVVEQGEIIVIIPDTITVAEALEIGQGLQTSTKDNKYPSEKTYAIKGYVSSIVNFFDPTYKNETFWITDEKGSRTSDKAQAFEVYRGKPTPAEEVGLDAYVLVTCKILNFNGTIENFDSNTPVQVLEKGGEVKVDTINVAQAMEIGNALEDNAYTENPYVIIGYVVKAYEPDEGYSNQNWYMADELNVKGDFYAYRCTPDSKVNTGDYVQLFGKIQKYVGKSGTPTIEVTNGQAKHLEAPKIDTINVAQALEIGAALENGGQSEKNYFVLGYVAEITEEYDGEELESFTLSDDETEVEAEFEARDARVGETAAAVHDKVLLFGKILKDEDGKIHMNMAAARVNPGQGIMNIVVTEKARKIVVDGVIYIVRDNKIFTLQGTQVR